MKKHIILILFALAAMQSTQPMGKAFAKKAFEKTCTALGWGIAAGPMWFGVANRLITNRSDECVDASHVVQDFCSKELRAMNMGPEKISIQVSKDPRETKEVDPINAHTFGRAIVIDYPEDIEFIVKETQMVQIADEKGLSAEILQKKHNWESSLNARNNQWRYIVQHEAAHIKNDDSRNIGIAAGIIPLISHAGFSLLRRKAPLSTLGHLKKIPAGIGKLVVNTVALSQYQKYREQEADNGVSNTRDILTGGYEFNKNAHQDLTEHLETTFYDHPDVHPAICRGARTLLYNLADPNHPTPLARMQKFEERLKKLEDAQKN